MANHIRGIDCLSTVYTGSHAGCLLSKQLTLLFHLGDLWSHHMEPAAIQFCLTFLALLEMNVAAAHVAAYARRDVWLDGSRVDAAGIPNSCWAEALSGLLTTRPGSWQPTQL